MKEIGIDISSQYSKTPQEFQDIIFDLAVIHKSFEETAAAVGSEEERLKIFRQVRDEIKDWILQTFEK